MTLQRCSSCGGTLTWWGGRLICPRAHCTGHDESAA